MTLDAQAPDDLDHELTGLLRSWLPDRRWYPAKGAHAELSPVGSVHLGDDVRVLLVRALADGVDVVLQVPLLVQRGPVPEGTDPAVVVGEAGGGTVLDATGDPRFLAAWLASADGPGAVVDLDGARVVTGEQSNTSVVLPGPDGTPRGMLKVLRTVADGPNPDIDVPRRLVDVGWDGVPAPLAWTQARWTGPDGAPAEGYLGVLSTFVPGAQDGFELACAWAREGRSFAEPAQELGSTIAGMHTALVEAFGTHPTGDGTAVAAALLERLTWATAAVPALAGRAPAVQRLADEVAALPSTPARQRVHGDLHLGQVLRSRGRWYAIDFEGEPLAPLDARVRPDLALRDVAGLLRSVDYAAAVGGLVGAPAAAWTADARAGLLAGYGVRADDDTSTLLLRALELDKTLYEAVYEARNRPAWAAIPEAGLDRLLG